MKTALNLSPFKEFMITEAISNSNANRAGKLIQMYLAKKMNKPFYKMPGIEEYSNSKENRGYGLRFFYGDGRSVRFNWASVSVDSSALSSVDIWLGSGKSNAPDLHMTFDIEMSLVKTLPIVAEILKAPKKGVYNMSIGDLKECFDNVEGDLLSEESFLINEERSGDKQYDDTIDLLKTDEFISSTGIPSFAYTIISKLRTSYPDQFEKRGRAVYFIGDPDFFRKNHHDVRMAIGRIKVTVATGPAKETYKPSSQAVEIENDQERIAYEMQIEDLEQLTKMVVAGASNALFVAGRGGTGKALAHGTGVLTPDGWVAVEDIETGDVVIAQDGSETLVEGVYPQGIRNTFEVKFSDGRSSVVDYDHLWEVNVEGSSKVMKTSDIKEMIDNRTLDRRITVPLFDPSPEKSIDVDLPIDPYLLGVLIGDGCLSSKSGISFTSADEFVVDEVKKLLPESAFVIKRNDIDYGIVSSKEYRGKKSPFNQALISLGVKEKRSFEKSIPPVYMNSSVNQKIQLIQGLMDSDGYASATNVVQFDTTSEKLAEDFCELIWSIGGKAKVKKHKSSYKGKDGKKIECRDAYNITIQYKDPKNLFRLPRKVDRVHAGQYSKTQLPITSIEEFGEVECTCIKVDHPRALFVIDDYVCTHNTHNVEKALAETGRTDGNGYFKNTGSASPVGIYILLYEHRDEIILFDDSDGALADQDGRNLLKAATDTKKVRKLAWTKKSSSFVNPDDIDEDNPKEGVYPKWFEFTGRVIFISNLPINKLDPDGALRTRALMINIDPTDMELVEFFYKICDTIELDDGLELTHDHRIEVIDEIKKSAKDLSIRKLVRSLNIRASMGNAGGWERFVQRYA